MKDDFTKHIGIAIALIIGILALDRLQAFVHDSGRLRSSPIGHDLDKVLAEMHNGDLNPEDFDALAAGYYEGLETEAGPIGLPIERDDVRFRNDFLRYELRPNVNRSYPAGKRITNSFGMANPEYPYQKPPHTRRIALVGDSISLGPYGYSYEALLERRLNQSFRTPDIQRFQVLNFAVYGYSILQMMDTALEKAPKFHPDVYIVAMTHLEVMPKAGWRTHVGRLAMSGTDLKYPYLGAVVARAGVQATDHLPTIRLKLAASFLPVTRWALEQIRDEAASQGAKMIIVLVPAPINPEFTASDFNRLHKAADDIGVPIIDLRGTFQSANLNDCRVSRTDIHPNAKGHRLIFENLVTGLQAQRVALSAIAGSNQGAAFAAVATVH